MPARPAAAQRDTSERPLRSTSRGRPRWALRGLSAVGLCVVLGAVGFSLLGLADFVMAGNGSTDSRARLAWTMASGDHLHFAFHMVAGRVLDLCPCTRNAAGTQYYRAHFHALTPRQKALAANTHPRTPGEWLNYVFGPAEVGADWIGDGLGWLGGRRPPRTIVVSLDGFAMQPAEIHVLRGTTVTWRNVDEQGEAHTVTADPGQLANFDSDFLEPDETFSATFTERGSYSYYCRLHGAAGLNGMAGRIVVE